MTSMNIHNKPGSETLTGMSPKRRRFLTKLVIVIAGGMFIDGFVLGSIGVVMPSITEELDLSAAWQGIIGASVLIGIFLGGPVGGYLADKVGRKPMFTLTLCIFLVGSIAQFFVGDAWSLFAVRLVMGIAVGADYAIGWPLLAEFAPARLRGKLLALVEVTWYVGYLASYASGYALVEATDLPWQVILGLSAIPTVIILLLRMGTPESPRWLMSQGKSEEATTLAAVYMEEAEQQDMQSELQVKPRFSSLFSRDYIKVTTFMSVFWICQVTPYFAIATFAPVVLGELGIEDGLTGALALNSVVLLGGIAAVLLVERIGRRKLTIPPFWISAAALGAIGLFTGQSPTLILLCFMIFSFFNAALGAMAGVYAGEVFPTEIRAAGVGFATAASRVGAAAGTFILPLSLEGLGVATTMYAAAALCVIGAVLSQFMAPETKGLMLSETSGAGRRQTA